MLIAWGMFGKFLGLLVAAGIGYFAFIKYKKNCAFNADELPGLLDGWNRSFYCHRCENVFQI